MSTAQLKSPKRRIVSREEWLERRRALMKKEKQMTRLREEMAADVRELPWVKVEKDYAFETAAGKKSLSDLFEGRPQLAVYHFMYGPDWDAGCPGCSLVMDHMNGAHPHLAARNVTFVCASRAPLGKLDAYKKRMGWSFPWVSSAGSDFNFDFGASYTKEQIESGEALYNFGTIPPYSDEAHGLSLFIKEGGGIFHTYSVFARGVEAMVGTFTVLDWAPKGRDEDPDQPTMYWLRRHDEYAHATVHSCCGANP